MKISREEIVELEYKLIKGIKESDIHFLDKVLHNDLLFLAPNGQIITKAIDLASHKAGEMVVEELIPTIEEIKIIEDTAVVVVVYDTKGVMTGNAIQGRFRYIRIWKKFTDGVKVIGGSCFQL
ncbi:MAG: nuclear transport factor 2 family protein [Bacteroidota bacterium]